MCIFAGWNFVDSGKVVSDGEGQWWVGGEGGKRHGHSGNPCLSVHSVCQCAN